MAIQTVDTIKQWFREFLYPTQQQFWDWLDSFRHKSDAIPMDDVDGLTDELATKATTAQLAALNNVITVGPGEYSKVIPAGTRICSFWVLADSDFAYSVGTTPGGTDIIDGEPTDNYESSYDKKVSCRTQKTLYFTGISENTTILIFKG